MIESIEAENLKSLSGIRHGFYTRNGGVSRGLSTSLNCGLSGYFDQNEVMENRRRVAEHIGVEAENLLSCWQMHSPDVVIVENPWESYNRPKADAMVTAEKNLALGILTADCVPLLFVDANSGVIGAAHAGWRGAIGGVIENTIEAMGKLGAGRDNIHAAIGPCIWQSSYEVGPEFIATFVADDEANQNYFVSSSRSNHFMFDLPAYVTARLRKNGINSIAPSPADTCADEARFFSYRRNCLQGEKAMSGSLISVIVL